MAGLRVGRVKIYNVKHVKTEVTLGPLKLGRNQKSFWIPSNQPPGWCVVGCAYFFVEKVFFWNTLLLICWGYFPQCAGFKLWQTPVLWFVCFGKEVLVISTPTDSYNCTKIKGNLMMWLFVGSDPWMCFSFGHLKKWQSIQVNTTIHFTAIILRASAERGTC